MIAYQRHRRAWQAGLTLVELMVVVAIVGILMAAAGLLISRDPTSEDVASGISGMISETSRKAVSGGAVDPEYVKTQVPSLGPIAAAARTRFIIKNDVNGQFAYIQRLDDGQAPPAWITLEYRHIHRKIEVVGYRKSAELEPGSAPTDLLSANQVELYCQPDGSCVPPPPGAGLTIYLRATHQPLDESRIVVMPLRGVPLVYSNW